MAESLHVIALISGGKDSFFSILHCMRNGHKVVAIANLYPPANPSYCPEADAEADEEEDLNSFMFQTVGHTVIPLYEQALGIPLYRQPITGDAVQTGTSYSHTRISEGEKDETESLIPLLSRVMREHPSANALSTGAILSTYQRTRVESVALRLGLTPLSFLWQYPVLPPATQTSLLEDMGAVGMDARIVKVASGGLDESFLWENVAGGRAIGRIERAVARFGADGDGAVLGEGGEFETLVVDGPRCLFKERIVVRDGDWKVVREGGGSAWLRVLDAQVLAKASESDTQVDCRIPNLLDQRFQDIFDVIQKETLDDGLESKGNEIIQLVLPYDLPPTPETSQDILYWTFTAKQQSRQSISDEAGEIMSELKQRLIQASLQATDIISTVIVLRSMLDFQAVNQVYGSLFTHPNPPSRVTISCGSAMPTGINLILHLKTSRSPLLRRGLHVQSRSYWAPANIGPYSQAISTSQDSGPRTVHIAGQIPLIPSTMLFPVPSISSQETFLLQTVLALQHLFRITQDTGTSWFTSAVVYLPSSSPLPTSTRALIAARAWAIAHAPPTDTEEDEDEDEAPDLWEAKHRHRPHSHSTTKTRNILPDHSFVAGSITTPPFFAVEVDELPRGAGVEWHAHTGLACSQSRGIRVSEVRDGVYECEDGERVYIVVMIYSQKDWRGLEDGFEKAGMCGCYVDVTLSNHEREGIWGWFGTGMVPCRSIWDGDGRRMAAVLLFDRKGI